MDGKGRIFKIKAADGIIAKYVVQYEVITTTIIDGSVKYTERRDIRELGYKNLDEYVTAIKNMGYVETN